MATKKPEPNPIARLLPYSIAAALGGFAVWAATRFNIEPASPLPVSASTSAAHLDPLRTRPDQFNWSQQPDPAFPIPPYARFLKDVSVVVDPGHIGQSEKNRSEGWKRGPTGLREAEANLRVALFLREFLESAGAKVTLTREQDAPRDISDEEDLADRAAIANKLHADVLVSIHHNASDKPDANYTAVFYHADGSASPASLCAGRNLLAGINDALRLEKQVDCGLWSDFVIYPNGFGLLRRLEIPGVLCESSFHTNPDEERRLRDPVYNRREAYGMFLGLSRWAQAGLPRVELIDPENARAHAGQTLTFRLDDGLSRRDGKGVRATKMLGESLILELEGQRLGYILNAAKGILQVTLPGDPSAARSVGPPWPTASLFTNAETWPDTDRVAATLATFPPPRSSSKKTSKPPSDAKAVKSKPPPRNPTGLNEGGARIPPPGGSGPRLFIDFENIFGQHVLHPWVAVSIE